MTTATFVDPDTGETFPMNADLWRAPSGAPLSVSGLPGIGRDEVDTSKRSLWRYAASFPMQFDTPVSLGEGCTPLVEGSFGGYGCKFKLEWFAPTGSFKDRGATVLISFVEQFGLDEVCEDSSGNGGSAIAAYGAAAGMTVHILCPAHTQPAKIAQVRAYGAHVTLVPGPREATEAAAIAMAERIFYASHNWHPMFLQGTKTLGYEIWEDLGFRVPDNIVIPSGAGSNVLGCYLAFSELMRAKATNRMPRIFLTQPEHCAPIHRSFVAGSAECVDIEPKPTVAEGTAIRKPIRAKQLLALLRETNGGTVAVHEADIDTAAMEMARNGLYVEPTCAHAAAGFKTLVAAGAIAPEQETIVVMTGTGLKATPYYAERLGE